MFTIRDILELIKDDTRLIIISYYNYEVAYTGSKSLIHQDLLPKAVVKVDVTNNKLKLYF